MNAPLRKAIDELDLLADEFATCLYVAIDDVRELGLPIDLNVIFDGDLPGNMGEHPTEVRRARRMIAKAMIERLLASDEADPHVDIEFIRPQESDTPSATHEAGDEP